MTVPRVRDRSGLNVTLFDSGNFITILESDSQIVKNYFKEIAKLMVEEGQSLPSTRDRDGEQEFRKRAKLRVGDVIEVEGYKVRIE